MAKTFICIVIFLSGFSSLHSQQFPLDSLRRIANDTGNDTLKLIWYRSIARHYAELNPDSSFYYSEKALPLCRKMGLGLDEGGVLREIGYAYLNRGNYPRSLQALLSSIAILEDADSEKNVLTGNFPFDDELNYRSASPHLQRLSQLAWVQLIFGVLYANSNNYQRARHHHLLAVQYSEQANVPALQSIVYLTFTRIYLNLKKTDSALICVQRAHELVEKSGYRKYFGSVLLNIGHTYSAMGKAALALDYYRKALQESAKEEYFRGVIASSLLLANHYSEIRKTDSAFQFANSALREAQKMAAPELLLRTYTTLARFYRSAGNNDSVVKYQALTIKINDSLFNAKQAQQFQNIDFEEQQRRREVETAQKSLREKWRVYALLAGLFTFLFIAIILWRNSRQRKIANLKLSEQKNELELTLSELKTTQKQLIQTEKMASLGELTAGIAHEIQNPLNFVNNFSEINKELLTEIQAEIQQGNLAEIKVITLSILSNEEKISHHGKRADAIVKGMLQHSRIGTGQYEPTDINFLADEYLRLAYHTHLKDTAEITGKDKDIPGFIPVVIESDFDETIGMVNIIPQDIGRVLLNLYNNSFYSVNEKQKEKEGENYEPKVSVITKSKANHIEITVKDNGKGIPQKIIDKIFQPFFTTKPAGQGTGLGLSISYDIIRAHDGNIRVDSVEGEGSEFIIELKG